MIKKEDWPAKILSSQQVPGCEPPFVLLILRGHMSSLPSPVLNSLFQVAHAHKVFVFFSEEDRCDPRLFYLTVVIGAVSFEREETYSSIPPSSRKAPYHQHAASLRLIVLTFTAFPTTIIRLDTPHGICKVLCNISMPSNMQSVTGTLKGRQSCLSGNHT